MGRFKTALLEDIWIKAFSMVFAVFLWMSVVGGESAEEFFVVPLTIRNVPENMIISNDVVDYVNVRVRGQRGILNSLNLKQIRVDLDVKDLDEGENTVTLFPEEVKLPEGVTAVRVSPSVFTIQLSRLAEKRLPVVPVFIGSPPSGFKVGEVITTPSKVAVTGLEEALRDQVQIETRPVELFGRDRPFSVEVILKPLNGNVYIQGPQKVKVDVEIVQKTSKREFRDLPVVMSEGSQGVVAKPARVTVTVSGPEMGLAEILPSSIQVLVPEQKGPGTYRVKPEVLLPKGYQVQKMQPETIQVKVGSSPKE